VFLYAMGRWGVGKRWVVEVGVKESRERDDKKGLRWEVLGVPSCTLARGGGLAVPQHSCPQLDISAVIGLS